MVLKQLSFNDGCRFRFWAWATLSLQSQPSREDRTLIIGTHGPLTPDYPTDPVLRDAKEFSVSTPVELVDDILIGQNLPAASLQVIRRVASS